MGALIYVERHIVFAGSFENKNPVQSGQDTRTLTICTNMERNTDAAWKVLENKIYIR